MTKAIYNIAKYVALILVIINAIALIQQEYYLRVFIMTIATVLYCIVLDCYKKKFKVFSPSMAFYVLVCFFSMTYCPFIYTNEKLQILRDSRPEGSVTPNDHFNIYVIVSIVISLCILIYIWLAKINKKLLVYKPIHTSSREDFCILWANVLIVFPLGMLVSGETIIAVGVTSFVYFVIRFIINGYKFTIPIFCGVLVSCIYVYLKVYTNRFQLIKYFVPILLFFIIYYSVCSKKMKAKTVYLLFILGVVAICLYGVVSEVYKLNNSYGQNLDIKAILSDTDLIFKFVKNQFYRIFEIWTPLGGNIIELVQREGFFYGLTYIKSIAPYFGLPYISLPKISAEYIMASYAQPGLVAEGYANFGIIGAIINVGLVFVLIEFCFRRFIKNRNMLNLLLAIVPFSGILLDGGTINDAIFNIVFILCTFIFSIFFTNKRKNATNQLLQMNI